MNRLIAAVVGATLLFSAPAAQAAQAPRAAPPVTEASALGSRGLSPLILLIVLLGVGLVLAVSGGGDGEPDSP